MNRFIDDEVYALVGVPSNVPPMTLVNSPIELLRSGGSQVFVHRVWKQLRSLLPVDSPYASVLPRCCLLRSGDTVFVAGVATRSTSRGPVSIQNCPPRLSCSIPTLTAGML